jgi:hypothetical protein
LFHRDARATVDLGSTVEIDPCPIGILSAQAGWGIGGPSPSCLARCRERTGGKRRQDLNGPFSMGCRAHRPFSPLGRCAQERPGGLVSKEAQCIDFSFFQKSFLNRISMNLMHFKFKFD